MDSLEDEGVVVKSPSFDSSDEEVTVRKKIVVIESDGDECWFKKIVYGENGCGIVGRCKTRHGEGGAQVQVGRDGGNPVRVPADGAGGSGRAAVPPTATADPGGFSQPGGGET